MGCVCVLLTRPGTVGVTWDPPREPREEPPERELDEAVAGRELRVRVKHPPAVPQYRHKPPPVGVVPTPHLAPPPLVRLPSQ